MSGTGFSKRVVISTDLQESDIRPPEIFSEFKRLSIHDASEYFADPASRVAVACPSCETDAGEPVFSRYDFLYSRCPACGSVYLSPRPNDAALADYYANSSASRFRVEHFSRKTAQSRRQHLQRSHAYWMGQIVDEAGQAETRAYADVDTYSPRIFDEMHRLEFFTAMYSVEPLIGPEGETDAPVTTIAAKDAKDLAAVSAFEKIEHQFSPYDYLQRLRDMLAPGGILFLTTRTIDGFDLQVLWDKTPYIFVPEHLNLLSIEGLGRLVERAGFEVVELSTPGQLDLQLVLHASQQDPSIRLPRFVEYLLHQRDSLAHADFQAFLQKHRLSSHVRVAARKPR